MVDEAGRKTLSEPSDYLIQFVENNSSGRVFSFANRNYVLWVFLLVASLTSLKAQQGTVRNFLFGHAMSKRCMYTNQKETASRVT